MGKEEHVFQVAEAGVDIGFVSENIQPGGCKSPGAERCYQGIVVDDIAAGGIDDDGAAAEAWQ